MSNSKKIILKSSDEQSFEVDETVARESQTIKHMIEDQCTGDCIPLPKVTSHTLAKVIEYCKKHVEAYAEDKAVISGNKEDEDLKNWDKEFVNVDQPTLFDILLAANYMNISGLLDLTCKTVADMMRGKTPQQIRECWNKLEAQAILKRLGLRDIFRSYLNISLWSYPSRIRKHFNIKNDYTPDEEAEVRRENQWAFE
ncbi:unnamed protein product [Cochlearia groenlandica]